MSALDVLNNCSKAWSRRLHLDPFRRLVVESLETRLALTTIGPLPEAIAGYSLAVYLEQPTEIGPLAPPVAEFIAPAPAPIDSAPTQDPAAVDAALASLAPTESPPEGEMLFNTPPYIAELQYTRSSTELVIRGRVVDAAPASCFVVVNGMNFSLEHVEVSSTGEFSITAPYSGEQGFVTAIAYDYYGLSSTIRSVYLS